MHWYSVSNVVGKQICFNNLFTTPSQLYWVSVRTSFKASAASEYNWRTSLGSSNLDASNLVGSCSIRDRAVLIALLKILKHDC